MREYDVCTTKKLEDEDVWQRMKEREKERKDLIRERKEIIDDQNSKNNEKLIMVNFEEKKIP